MQHASSTLRKIFGNALSKEGADAPLLAWPLACGSKIGEKTSAVAYADGTLTVIHQDTPDQYKVTETVPTPPGSRNMGLDPTNHRIFVVAAKFGPASAGSKRGTVLPGTFSLLVIERDPAAH